VGEFLLDPETFMEDTRAHNLTGKTVYVDGNRIDADQAKQDKLNSEESRYWNFCEVQQRGSIEDLNFRKKITVARQGGP
jgi:hypothetical protein